MTAIVEPQAALQLFDALPAHIEDALRASIERFGVLVPVVKDQHGRIIDGHHRSRIADAMGVGYRVDVRQVDSDEEAREIALTLNSDRRQLSEEQRREVVRVLREQGHSIRAIADALKVGKSTVADDIKGLSGAGQLAAPDRVARQGGGSYPAARPKPELESASEPEKAEAACEACGGPMDAGQHEKGFMRCDACDGDDAHVAAGFPHDRSGGCATCASQTEVETAPVPEVAPAGEEEAAAPASEVDGEEPPLPGMPEGQEWGAAFAEGVDVGEAAAAQEQAPERPRPPKWDPEDRKRHEAEVARIRDIQAARDQSKTIVTDVLTAVCVVVAGCRYGETGLVTKEMIAKLREAIDLLEGELP